MLLMIWVISKLAMLRSYFPCTTITQLYCSIVIFADDWGHQQNSNAMTISTHNKTAAPSMGTATSKPYATNTEIYNAEILGHNSDMALLFCWWFRSSAQWQCYDHLEHNKTAAPSMGTVTSKPYATNTEIYNAKILDRGYNMALLFCWWFQSSAN